MSKIIRKIRMLDKARKNREYGIEHKSDSNEKILDKITLRVFRANHAKKNKPSEFMQTAHDTDKYLQFSYCIKCGLCYSACPTVATDTKFPGPQALSQAYRYHADTRDIATKDRLHMVDTKHGIWRCHFAGSCSKVCPKGVDPALGIQLLRGYLMGYSKNEKKIAEQRERLRKVE